jgi:CheY-like chemotaxis protein
MGDGSHVTSEPGVLSISLRSPWLLARGSGDLESATEALERIVQEAVRITRANRPYLCEPIEGVNLLQAVNNAPQRDRIFGIPSPDSLVAVVECRIADRKYKSRMPFVRKGADLIEIAQRLYEGSADLPAGGLSSDPQTQELLRTIAGHLWCDSRAQLVAGRSVWGNGVFWERMPPAELSLELASPRRAAVQNWATRLERRCEERHQHVSGGWATAAYPWVDGIPLDPSHAAVVMVAPFDPNFVDDSVDEKHRLGGVVVAVYRFLQNGESAGIGRFTELLRPMFGRLVFMSFAEHLSEALQRSHGEGAGISRSWYARASNGLRAVLSREEVAEPFDGLRFAERVVRGLLCEVPGVSDTEVCRFDRAFIFGEAGTANGPDSSPLRMVVLESSVKSESPIDQGGSLDRHERTLYGTHDVECRLGIKTIESEGRFPLFVLRGADTLMLSRQPTLDRSLSESGKSSGKGPGTFPIDHLPQHAPKGGIDGPVCNVLMRLLKQAEKVEAVGVSGKLQFEEDWEKLHLLVLKEADEHGLFFKYAQGLDLVTDAPFLHRLQTSYREHVLQRRLDEFKREMKRRRIDPGDAAQLDKDIRDKLHASASKSSKVIFISFAADVHDANIAEFRKAERKAKKDGSHATPILGPEYQFSIILVADYDPETPPSEAERERADLRGMLQVLLAQVWMNKATERESQDEMHSTLDKVYGYLHSIKSLAGKNPELQDIVLTYMNSVRAQTFRNRQATTIRLAENGDVLRDLLNNDDDDWLDKQIHRHDDLVRVVGAPLIEEATLPALSVHGDRDVIREAMAVVLKNALESASGVRITSAPKVPGAARVSGGRAQTKPISSTATAAPVRIRVELVPVSGGSHWLDVVVENGGGPIGPRRLAALNAETPQDVGASKDKSGSTGVGVATSRRLLHKLIGKGADILYLNLPGDRVQARLRLPVSLDELLADGDAAPSGLQVPTEPYVLYVEDVERNSTPVRRAIEAAGWPVKHFTNAELALDCFETRRPAALVTDIMIFHDESGGEARLQYGKELLQRVFERVAADGGCETAGIPVWIVSAENIAEQFGDDVLRAARMEAGYRFCSPNDPPSEWVRRTSLLNLGVKNPFDSTDWPQDKCESAKAALYLLSQRVGDPGSSAHEEKRVTSTSHFRATWRPGLPELRKRIDQLRESDGERRVLAITSQAGTVEQLGGMLKDWFLHKGVESPEPTLLSKPPLRPLSSEHHRRLVFSIHVLEAVPGPGVSLRYWLLVKNVLVSREILDLDELANHWLAVDREGRGPLSQLRHAVINRVSDKSQREALREQITTCERLLWRGQEADGQYSQLIRSGHLPWIDDARLRDADDAAMPLASRHLNEMAERLLELESKDRDLAGFAQKVHQLMFLLRVK